MKTPVNLVTEPDFDGGERKVITTDRITVGPNVHGEDIEIYVEVGEILGQIMLHRGTSAVVIALDTDPMGDDSKWGVLAMDDPAVVRHTSDTLAAAALVLEQVQAGELPLTAPDLTRQDTTS